MKIILNSGGVEHILCHGYERGAKNKLLGPFTRRSGRRTKVEMEDLLRGEWSSPVNRKNKFYPFSFYVEVECDTEFKAEEYALIVPMTFPDDGILNLIIEDTENRRVVIIDPAVIESIDVADPVGVLVTITFNILGGQLSWQP